MKPNVVGFVFARGGSMRIPKKNIRFLAGKPLIAYAIEIALQSRFINRVVVSTDDDEIARVAKEFGAEVPFLRPKELAQNDSPEWLAWKHAIRTLNTQEHGNGLDIFVSIPPTAPLRTVEDVDKCIETYLTNDVDAIITVKNAAHHPSFNMVMIDENNYTRLVLPPDKPIIRSQDAPPVYDMLTVAYVAKPEFILEADSLFDGRVKSVLVPEERALDIDTETDFKLAEYMVSG